MLSAMQILATMLHTNGRIEPIYSYELWITFLFECGFLALLTYSFLYPINTNGDAVNI
jgi:hypothetical protein